MGSKKNGKPRYCYKYKKMGIIVVEDHKINQKLIQIILQTAGYAVNMVDNGCDAVALAGSAFALEKAAELAQVEPVRHLVGRIEENLNQLENHLQNLSLSISGIIK